MLFILKDSQIEKLQIMQNKPMRFILRKPYDTHIKDMLINLHWLSIKQLIFFHSMKFIYKIKIGQLPDYLRNCVKFNYEIHDRAIRSKNSFKLPLNRTESEKNSLFYKDLKCFNELPVDLINSNYGTFKRKLYNYSKTLDIR